MYRMRCLSGTVVMHRCRYKNTQTLVARCENHSAGRQAMASDPIRSVVVLCVDDDVILSLLQAALEGQGIGFLAATNGREALEVAARRRPDGVILDHQLPDMTGGTLAAEIKRVCPDTIIIMFSALPELPPDAVGFLDTFVHKGEGVRPLLSALQRLLMRPHTFGP